MSYNRLNEIGNDIDSNKGLTSRIKDESGKIIIIIYTKYATDLMELVSKNGITYDKVSAIFNDEIIKSANIIASEKPSDNRTKLLKVFLDIEEVLLEYFTALKLLMINMES